MSTIAVGLVLTGGTAVAANTIGSSDIKNGAVRSIDLKNNDVSSVDIKNGQVKPNDLAKASKLTTKIVTTTTTLQAGQSTTVTASCKGKDVAVGSGSPPSTAVFVFSARMRPKAVEFEVAHLGDPGSPPSNFTAQVVCLRGGALR